MVALALYINFLQVLRPAEVLPGHRLDEPLHLVLEVRARAVEVVKERVDGIEIRPEPGVEVAHIVLPVDFRFERDEDRVEQ